MDLYELPDAGLMQISALQWTPVQISNDGIALHSILELTNRSADGLRETSN